MKPREIKKFRESYNEYDKPCMFEGYKLAVLFDEKDEVKSKGARWDKEESTWWIPSNKLQDESETFSTVGTETVHEWLNNRKMIMGQYGTFDTKNDMDAIPNSVAGKVIYRLAKVVNGIDPYVWCFIDHYTTNDVVKITHMPTLPAETVQWTTLHDARKKWGELVEEGYTAFLDNSPENDENNS